MGTVLIPGTVRNESTLQPTSDAAAATNAPTAIAPGSSASSVPQPGATTLANDLYAGRPILAQVYSALNAGEPSNVNAFLDKSGYEITSEGIQQVLKSTQPGHGFDIRSFGGLYKFTAPDELTSYALRLDPTTTKIYIGATAVNNTTDSRGHVLFDFQSLRYDLVFESPTGLASQPKVATVKGTRTTLADPKGPTSDVSGTQQDASSPPQDWAEMKGSLQAAYVLSLFGLSWTVLFTLIGEYRNWKAKKEALAKDEVAKRIEKLSEPVKKSFKATNELVLKLAELSDPGGSIDVDRGVVEDAVTAGIKAQLDLLNKDPRLLTAADRSRIMTKAAEAMREAVRTEYLDEARPLVLDYLGGLGDLLGDDALEAAVEHHADLHMSEIANKLRKLGAGSPWLQATIDAVVANAGKEAYRELGDLTKASQTATEAIIEQNNHDRAENERKLAKYKSQFDDLKLTEAEMSAHQDEHDAELGRLENQMQSAEQELNRQQEQEEWHREEEADFGKEAEEAKKQADEHAVEAFGE
ncbi:hypothetical protein LTR91_004316 [Friedmanniomyces endolithicus]|uniref:Uncharacterized protein n=1 Tax=Friedmanniomyces endolithicus TaxID=329885 RepID=A0AAN6QYW3_9PEZI|nr:hypothetical protein LTR75_014434 [Friedmanniomyces endolithicus]KAK0881440.1 hypothetical protein LTR87_004778 [Friedmanniomyces endolithicus]KAK0897232.1 hypothetical protein LTR57_022206 [Friedmanniomyces endolithicus]KAK1004821.1 hypothetical protein LTR91_004316 [Friedmanniomyces endolithicus]KAK1056841.1 hypothetical protein LTR33_013790 [Friedmanniomyces endolithicus]